MFEVGKKYKGNFTGVVRECVAIHGLKTWLVPVSNEGGHGALVDLSDFKSHTEYKEPRSARPLWLNVYEYEGQLHIAKALHLSKESAKDAVTGWGREYKLIETIKVTYTEKTDV